MVYFQFNHRHDTVINKIMVIIKYQGGVSYFEELAVNG